MRQTAINCSQTQDSYNNMLKPQNPSTNQETLNGKWQQTILSFDSLITRKLKGKSKSRRTTERRKKRYNKANNLVRAMESENSIKIRCIEKLCQRKFGFSANPKLTLQQNFNKTMKLHPHLSGPYLKM
jgi:hypothetical protein